MTSAEIVVLIKDILIAGAAVTTAVVALIGLRSWIVELRGRTSFDVARGLMRATYALRDEVARCRSPMVLAREFPDDYPGGSQASSKQELDAWAHVYKNRWAPVWEALQDYDARALESEALWGSDIRAKTDQLRRLVIELNVAIDAFLSDKFNRGEDFRSDKEFGLEMRSKLGASLGNKDNEHSQKIAKKIIEIEGEIRPHIGAS